MLEHKSIVVIGGTTGLGYSAAKAFLRHGAKVLVIGRDQESCDTAKASLGDFAHMLAGDATGPLTAPMAISECIKVFGSFDGLYHVAGGSGRKFGDGPLHELTLEGWNKTIEWNLTSLMLSNQAAVQHFIKTGKPGSILNMGSVLGSFPSPGHFSTHAYAAAKSAIIGFTRSTAAYYAPYNIRINVLAPALVATPMSARAQQNDTIMHYVAAKQPLDGGRIGVPEDLDEAAVFFLSDAAKFITGQVLYVDGGWSVTG